MTEKTKSRYLVTKKVRRGCICTFEDRASFNWDTAVHLYCSGAAMRKTTVLRPCNVADFYGLRHLQSPFVGQPDFTTRSLLGFVASLYLDFDGYILEFPYTEVLQRYFSGNFEYPTVLWLHYMCAYSLGRSNANLYPPSPGSSRLLRLAAGFLKEAWPADAGSDCWIDLRRIDETDFYRQVSDIVRPTSFGPFEEKYDRERSWTGIWISGIYGLFTVLGLVEIVTDDFRFSIDKLRFIRPTRLLFEVAAFTGQTAQTDNDPEVEPAIVLDHDRLIARFTSPVGRALLIEAGAKPISSNRVVFDKEGLARGSGTRPLAIHRERFLHLSGLDSLPDVWETLFSDVQAYKNAIEQVADFNIFKFHTQTDLQRFLDILRTGEPWTRHVLLTESQLILIHHDHIDEVLIAMRDFGITISYW
ncbi:MAG: hypothetical protein K2M19_01915 [Muribaculaceae bacterium]|nr:hypothetical protein [Muribaculaceae bacterium]